MVRALERRADGSVHAPAPAVLQDFAPRLFVTF
jgi:hypothetical protein